MNVASLNGAAVVACAAESTEGCADGVGKLETVEVGVGVAVLGEVMGVDVGEFNIIGVGVGVDG